MLDRLKEKIKNSKRLKNSVLYFIVHPYLARPRWWIRWFVNPFIIKKGKGAVIRHNTRIDILPFNRFEIGIRSVIESFATINNGVGNVIVGNYSRIGIGCTIIGPVQIGNDVQLAQNITISGLNHNYLDITHTINSQKVTTAPIVIADDVWIGANSVVVAGVSIGTHSVIAGGSVVTKNIPPYSIAAGNPARIIKKYDFNTQTWVRL